MLGNASSCVQPGSHPNSSPLCACYNMRQAFGFWGCIPLQAVKFGVSKRALEAERARWAARDCPLSPAVRCSSGSARLRSRRPDPTPSGGDQAPDGSESCHQTTPCRPSEAGSASETFLAGESRTAPRYCQISLPFLGYTPPK